MKKKVLNLLLGVFVGVLFIFSFGCVDTFAQNGPDTKCNSYSDIAFYDYNIDNFIFIYHSSSEYADCITKINGVVYNKNTNTLTLTNYSNDGPLYIDNMGEDFKIVICGTNNIGTIYSYVDDYTTNLNISGNGTLNINKDKLYDCAIEIDADNTKSFINVGQCVNLNLYAPTNSKVIVVNNSAYSDLSSVFRFCGNIQNKPEYCTSAVYNLALSHRAFLRSSVDMYMFKKANDSTEYAGIYDSNGYYYMYTIKKDSKYGYIATSINNNKGSINVENAGYVIQDNKYSNVLINRIQIVYICRRANDNCEYGYTYNDKLQTFNIYKFEEDATFGYIANPIAENIGAEEFWSTYPKELRSMVYDYYINQEQLNIKAKSHVYTKTITKATTTKVGKIIYKCSKCGYTKTSAIAKISSVKLSTTQYTYTSAVRKPVVTVKDSNGKTISSSYYTVTYSSGRKNVGKYSVKIVFKGNYSGIVTRYFTIRPVITGIKSLTRYYKAFTVNWYKKTTQVTGYQIHYSTSSKFTSSTTKSIMINKNITSSKKITGLKSNKKYYVRVRTYKTVGSTKYFSAWSTVKSVKTK